MVCVRGGELSFQTVQISDDELVSWPEQRVISQSTRCRCLRPLQAPRSGSLITIHVPCDSARPNGCSVYLNTSYLHNGLLYNTVGASNK